MTTDGPRTLDAPAPVLALGPAPAPTYVALGRLMGCARCLVAFDAQRTCPACQGDDLWPIEEFFRRRDGAAHERATVAELEALHVLKSA